MWVEKEKFLSQFLTGKNFEVQAFLDILGFF